MIADMKDKGDFKINGGRCLCDGVFLEKKHGYGFEIGEKRSQKPIICLV